MKLGKLFWDHVPKYSEQKKGKSPDGRGGTTEKRRGFLQRGKKTGT